MADATDAASFGIQKIPTRVPGLDEVLGGGLPEGRVTVVVGATGSGKTLMGLQFLVGGLRGDEEPGIFVSFEESESDIRSTMQSLRWPVSGNGSGAAIHIMEAEFLPDTLLSGTFDLNGLLAALSTLVEETGATRVVFDAVDALLELLDDRHAQRRELRRLFQWVRERNLTAVLTAKSDDVTSQQPLPNQPLLLYLSHCVMVLRYELQDGICSRSIRLLKYRGSSHSLNEMPMTVGAAGLAVFGIRSPDMTYRVFESRVSTGVDRLDTMLGGGLYRGSGILVSGSPGTAKTTLGGAFLDAACAHGERGLFISLDEAPEQIVRNLKSVGIDLKRHLDSGALLMRGYRAGSIETEVFLMKVLSDLASHGATTLVLDPISALSNRTQFRGKNDVGARLLDEAKARGITVLFTSLLSDDASDLETSQASISTIADTWMQVSFKASGGERNRALTIIKSRGMSHSNQVRELVITRNGLTLANVYTAGGDVLMGTARLEREMEIETAETVRRNEFERRRAELELVERRLATQLAELEAEIQSRRTELQTLEDMEEIRRTKRDVGFQQVSDSRRADV